MTSLTHTEDRIVAELDFETVYRSRVSGIYRFCLIQLRDPSSAEDATADVFSAAFRSWHRVDPAFGVDQWLFRIARNTITDHYRAQRRRDLLHSVLRRGRRTDSAPDPEATAGLREEVTRVGNAIAHLKRRDQVLVGLRISGDLSHAQIGRIVGMSEDSVRVAIHRALKRVRQTLEDER